jgi:signal transduction histidine kinase
MPLTLRTKTFLILSLLIAATFTGSVLSFRQTRQMQFVLEDVVTKDIAGLRVAQELQYALVMQKGYLTYYLMSGNEDWLRQLSASNDTVNSLLLNARNLSEPPKGRELLNIIESSYVRYVTGRDQVVELYRRGELKQGTDLHWMTRTQFFELHELCEKYRRVHQDHLDSSIRSSRERETLVTATAVTGVVLTGGLGLLLALFMSSRIFRPLRQMVVDHGAGKQDVVEDEVKLLKARVRNLIESVDVTKTKLEESREHLQQTEKLVMVGKLAAGVAHSVRNPLTSVKMRLFSLQRSLEMTPVQREDFEVISEEISHIDTILRNFLEFSRRPKLKFHPADPAEVVDMAIQLLRYRFESNGIEVTVQKNTKLHHIMLDADHLKEVLVNILENACDVLPEGGKIDIALEEGYVEPASYVLVIRITDNGPGIPEAIQADIFQPFFSTKEEGTGLGLSIAKRFVEEHGGWLNVKSREGSGTSFIITLPIKGEKPWARY